MPANLDLDSGYSLRFNAIDPVTGGNVSGVKVSAATIMAANLAGAEPASLERENWVLVPGPE